MNFDETPVPFEWNEGATYEHKGAKTVQANTDRAGWNKRQAIASLFLFADGVPRINPEIIFHRKPTRRLYAQESPFYYPRVRVVFNEKAYANRETTDKFFNNVLLPTIRAANNGKLEDFLLVFDCASFHKTPALLKQMRKNQVVLALVPPGCTPLV